MIDDDEVARRIGWSGCCRRRDLGADIVGGPRGRISMTAEGRSQRHPAFAPAYQASGPVPVIYGCGNCLIRRAVFERFDSPSTCGSTSSAAATDFFARARRAGFRFFWAREADISETVPSTRTSLGWIVRRGLRIGAINYHIERKAAQTIWSRAIVKAKMFGLVPFSLYRFTRIVLREHQAVIAMHPMVVAVGSALAVLGIEPQPYAAAKIAS